MIGAHSFVFAAELRENGSLKVTCRGDEAEFFPLCMVLETAWSDNPHDLVASVVEEHGTSFEGDVSYAYNQDYPEESPDDDGVTLDFLGDELQVSKDFFKTSVANYAAAYFSLADTLKVDTTPLTDVRTWQAEVLAAG